MAERVERIAALAARSRPLVGADPDLAAQAARLAKADLGTGMVGEFPELQGVMGGYYARARGPGAARSPTPIRDHYKPRGPERRRADRAGDAWPWPWPTSSTPWSASSPSTRSRPGSQGPLRPAPGGAGRDPHLLLATRRFGAQHGGRCAAATRSPSTVARSVDRAVQLGVDLLAFFADRLKVLLRDQGKRHDLVDAVFALGDDDLVRIVAGSRR